MAAELPEGFQCRWERDTLHVNLPEPVVTRTSVYDPVLTRKHARALVEWMENETKAWKRHPDLLPGRQSIRRVQLLRDPQMGDETAGGFREKLRAVLAEVGQDLRIDVAPRSPEGAYAARAPDETQDIELADLEAMTSEPSRMPPPPPTAAAGAPLPLTAPAARSVEPVEKEREPAADAPAGERAEEEPAAPAEKSKFQAPVPSRRRQKDEQRGKKFELDE